MKDQVLVILIPIIICVVGVVACSGIDESYQRNYANYLQAVKDIDRQHEIRMETWAQKVRDHQVLTVQKDGSVVYNGPIPPIPLKANIVPPKKDPPIWQLILNSPVAAGLVTTAANAALAYAVRNDDGDQIAGATYNFDLGDDSQVNFDSFKKNNGGVANSFGASKSFIGDNIYSLDAIGTDSVAEFGTDTSTDERVCLDCFEDTDTDTDTSTETDTDTDTGT
jgi:hypothetical protein